MSENFTTFHLQGNDLLEEKQKVSQHLGVSESRSAGEAKCDQHMETFVKCIKASGGSLEIKNTSAPSINPVAACHGCHRHICNLSAALRPSTRSQSCPSDF